MNFYVWWLISIGASFVMDFQNGLRLFKDAADAGYKIDLKRYSTVLNDENLGKINTLKLLIPGLNIFTVFQRAFNYNQARRFILDELSVMGLLKEMTNEEKKLYQTKPTAFNSFVISIKSEIDSRPVTMTIYYGEGNQDKMVFEFDKDRGIIIKEVTGPRAFLSIFEQKEFLKKDLTELFDRIDKFGGVDLFAKKLVENRNVSLALQEENNQEKEISVDDKKQQLKEQKEQLILQKEEILSSINSNEEKNKVKKIKR